MELLSEDWDSALNVLQPALNLESPNVEVLELTGKILIRQEKFNAALKVFENAHNRFPYQTHWLQGLSLIYLKLDQPKKLQETLLKLVHLDSADGKSMKLLMQLFFDQKNYERALHWGTEALYVNVLDPEIHHRLAQSALQLKKTDIAIRELRMTLHLEDKNEELRFLLAKTLLDSGKSKEALTELNLLLQQNPKHTRALELKKQL